MALLGFPARQDYRGLMTPEPEKFQVALLLPNEERSIEVSRDEHIWDAAFAAGIALPAMCHQGYCLTCAGRLENEGKWISPIRWSTSRKIAKRVSCCYAPGSRARL